CKKHDAKRRAERVERYELCVLFGEKHKKLLSIELHGIIPGVTPFCKVLKKGVRNATPSILNYELTVTDSEYSV
ncbi:MAG: hypothetical protein Q8868_12545, partial [Bacteroidota bacterium]|nr:hypothetical protein [Bacteroidota bacterium]